MFCILVAIYLCIYMFGNCCYINFAIIHRYKKYRHSLHVLCGHVVHSSSALTVLVVQEVVSGDGPVLGIAVDDSYLTLPAEVFTNKNGSGIKSAQCAHIAICQS